MKSKFDQYISGLQERLRQLPANSVAVFSAACTERLVEWYERFAVQNGWDSYPVVRRVLNSCWEVLAGNGSDMSELNTFSAQLIQYVPHADDFAGLLCIGAQDFSACLESTIKWIVHAPDARYGVVYYAVEALRAAAINRRFGKSWTSGPKSDFDETFVMTDPAVTTELAAQEGVLAVLEGNSQLTEREVELIREASIDNRQMAKEN